MYYFETINILSVFQDMLKIKFKLFTIYFNILNCVKLYFFTIHLKHLAPFILRQVKSPLFILTIQIVSKQLYNIKIGKYCQ